MIHAKKYRNAIIAIQDVIILARKLAYENADITSIASLLDTAEYLPSLVLDDADRTFDFREQIKELAEEYSWAKLIDQFDDD